MGKISDTEKFFKKSIGKRKALKHVNVFLTVHGQKYEEKGGKIKFDDRHPFETLKRRSPKSANKIAKVAEKVRKTNVSTVQHVKKAVSALSGVQAVHPIVNAKINEITKAVTSDQAKKHIIPMLLNPRSGRSIIPKEEDPNFKKNLEEALQAMKEKWKAEEQKAP